MENFTPKFYKFNVKLWDEELKYKYWLHLHRSRYALSVTEDLMQIFCSQNVSQSSLSQESEQNISIRKQERNPNFAQLKQRKITTNCILYYRYPSSSNRASDND